jgi:hypothetical protein
MSVRAFATLLCAVLLFERKTGLVAAYELNEIVWKSAYDLSVGGLAFPPNELESPFDRLPAAAKFSVPEGVWNQSILSAGVFVEFETDASEIWVNYTIENTNTDLWNLEAGAYAGVDIFAVDVLNNFIYRWVGTWELPAYPSNIGMLVNGLAFNNSKTQYRVNFPLWSRVVNFAVGVPNVSKYFDAISSIQDNKPHQVIWYGTSIAQGKSSSIPSSAYLNQLNLALWQNIHILNFGFSSNGKMDESVMVYLNSILPTAAFVIDCLPNMGASDVASKTSPLVYSIRDTHARNIPIILVESATYGEEWYNAGTAKSNADKRAALKQSFDDLVAQGVPELYYVTGNQVLSTIIACVYYVCARPVLRYSHSTVSKQHEVHALPVSV